MILSKRLKELGCTLEITSEHKLTGSCYFEAFVCLDSKKYRISSRVGVISKCHVSYKHGGFGAGGFDSYSKAMECIANHISKEQKK